MNRDEAKDSLLSEAANRSSGYDSTTETEGGAHTHMIAVAHDPPGPTPIPNDTTVVIHISSWAIQQRIFQNVAHPPQPTRYEQHGNNQLVTQISDVVRGDLFIDEAFGIQMQTAKHEIGKVTRCCDSWGEVKIWLGEFNLGGVQHRAKEIFTFKKNILTAGHTSAAERLIQGIFSIASFVGGFNKLPEMYIPGMVVAILFAVRIWYNRKQLLAFVEKLRNEFIALGDVNSVFGRRAKESTNMSMDFGLLRGRWVYHVRTINTQGTETNRIDPKLQQNFTFTWTSASLETVFEVTPYKWMIFLNLLTTVALVVIIAVAVLSPLLSSPQSQY